MIIHILAALVLPLTMDVQAPKSDLTRDEPITRAFGETIYSEAICPDHRERSCVNNDTRVSVSFASLFIYDFGDELNIIYKGRRCRSRSYASYNDIRSKNKLRNLVSEICSYYPEEQQQKVEVLKHLDEIYAATQYMKERAGFVFDPVNRRCEVKRSHGYPVYVSCKGRSKGK